MNIKAIVAECGKTHSQIAEEVGVSRGYVSLVINGERLVGPEKIRAFADALGVEPKNIRPDLASLFEKPRKAGSL